MFWSSKNNNIEILNHINKLENKFDILINTQNCKERDIKVNEMLVTFLESKFSELDIDNSILMSVKTELQNTLVSKEDHKSSLELLTESINNLTNEINQLKETSTNESNNIKNGIDNLLKQTQPNELNNLTNEIKQLKEFSTKESNDIKKEFQQLKQTPNSDKLLRSDLNTFLVAIKDDIKSDIKGSMQITLQNNIDNNNVLKNTLDILINKTDAIFFDNEIIKHQFSIEENVKIYSDTIDSLKLSIEKSINDIDNILIKNDFL